MKAVICRQPEGLAVVDIPRPDPDPDQVLIRVANTGFCGSDHSIVASGQCTEGVILGHETSGVVEAVGADVRGVNPGARVMIRPTYCGECPECRMGKPYFCLRHRRLIGLGDLPGGFAEYLVVYPAMLIPVPSGVDSHNAALAEAFAASLHGIRCSRAKEGSALVIGGGAIGLAAVMLLKMLGFGPVALSEPVAEKRDLAQRFGADRTMDPVSEDLVYLAHEITGMTGFDTVFECSGAPPALQNALDTVRKGGTVCIVSVFSKAVSFTPITMTFKECWVTASYSNTHEENKEILAWMASGRLDGRPLITDVVGLADLPRVYAERIDTGRAVKVMLAIGEEF